MNALKSFIYQEIVPALGRLTIGKNRYINVIYYHDVVKGEGSTYMRINFERFKQQMLLLKKMGYETFVFQELGDKKILQWNRKHILITFDDGWLSNYDEIFDFMKAEGIKYNIFLETAKIGKDPKYLSWDTVREMYKSGLVGFGAHTFSHPDMSKLESLDLNQEIDAANEIINTELGFIPEDFCFPYGAYSQETIAAILEKKVYKRIYTSDMRYSYQQRDAIIFGRNAISDSDSEKIFKNKASGKYNIFNSLTHFL